MKDLTYAHLAELFHLPEKAVAKELGICLTSLKKVCRQFNIQRWPYRQVQKINKHEATDRNLTPICTDADSSNQSAASVIMSRSPSFSSACPSPSDSAAESMATTPRYFSSSAVSHVASPTNEDARDDSATLARDLQGLVKLSLSFSSSLLRDMANKGCTSFVLECSPTSNSSVLRSTSSLLEEKDDDSISCDVLALLENVAAEEVCDVEEVYNSCDFEEARCEEEEPGSSELTDEELIAQLAGCAGTSLVTRRGIRMQEHVQPVRDVSTSSNMMWYKDQVGDSFDVFDDSVLSCMHGEDFFW